MPEQYHSKALIIGAGPAGYTAAIYAARANLQPILVTGMQPGGQMTITTDVENYPGFADVIQGPWLMEQMQAQAEHVGTRVVLDEIAALDLARRPFVATGDSGDRYIGETVIICTGAQARWLGLASETAFRGFGVSACATCDGFFFRDKEVVVVGGGNTAVEEAIYLTNHARQVTLVHRRDTLRAEKILQERLFRNPRIGVVWDSVVEDILGVPEPPQVTGVRLRNVRTGAVTEFPCDGVFIAIGHNPVTGLVAGQLPLDAEGYILTEPDSTATAIAGVYAAGDVRDKIFRQAVTAAGMGCMAALEAEKFLAAEAHTASARAAE
ncbi:MAG TPA: thioredoxin-disulfide reductase [Stellaceae bacterium]|jgi:thioredoxin reductase (NADPH)|nr:thioredoxin-disulfide reductase [Stellaceae bacterium]